MKERESDIQSAICDYLAYRKVFFLAAEYRANDFKGQGRVGISPDAKHHAVACLTSSSSSKVSSSAWK